MAISFNPRWSSDYPMMSEDEWYCRMTTCRSEDEARWLYEVRDYNRRRTGGIAPCPPLPQATVTTVAPNKLLLLTEI